MAQIINFVLFLKEIVFGRDASSVRGKRSVASLVVITMLIASIGGNVVLFRSLYTTAAQQVILKREVKRLQLSETKMLEYKERNKALTDILTLLDFKISNKSGRLPDEVPLPPSPAAIVPREVVREEMRTLIK